MCVILLFSNKTDKKHENIKDTLFQNANIILYKQKSSKKHYQFFSYRFSSKKEIQMCYNGLSPFFPVSQLCLPRIGINVFFSNCFFDKLNRLCSDEDLTTSFHILANCELQR